MSGRLANPMMVSAYCMRPDGDVFGRFSAADGNMRLGYACEQTVNRCDDRDPRVRDIFGFPVRRGVSAQHVSGRDKSGEFTCGGLIREIGINREIWSDNDDSRPSVIVRRPLDRSRLHVAEWSDADYWLTMDGLRAQYDEREPFTPQDVLRAIDKIRGLAQWRSLLYGGDLHVKAVRRWLESMVGVSNISAGAAPSKNYPSACGAMLERHRRWSYFFLEPA